jgi:hypothetical protein
LSFPVGTVSCLIYDKTREIKGSGKQWFADRWLFHRWGGQKDGKVWRVAANHKFAIEQHAVYQGLVLTVNHNIAYLRLMVRKLYGMLLSCLRVC